MKIFDSFYFCLFVCSGGETAAEFCKRVKTDFCLRLRKKAFVLTVFMALRLMYLVAGSSLMTFTTSPNGLMDGMEKLLNPLNKLHLPVAMIMSIALRFIPILLEETDKIMKAQIARGADFESGNIIQRAKAMIPILVPLFVSAFRRANDLAMAMEARCYHGGEGRTRMKPLKYNGRDKAAYLITILCSKGVFAVGKFVPFSVVDFLKAPGDGGEYRVSGGLRFQLWILQRQPMRRLKKVFGMTGLCGSAFPGIDGEGKSCVCSQRASSR